MRANPGRLTSLMLEQLLLRLLAIFPVLLSLRGVAQGVSGWICLGLTLLIYAFLVMPMRFYAGQKMGRMLHPGLPADFGFSYLRCLKKGLIRLGMGLPFGIPFLAAMGYLAIGPSVLPMNDMWQPIQNLALIVGMEPKLINGGMVGLVLLVLMILLFCVGWLMNMPAEYLPLSGKQPWHGGMRKGKIGRLLVHFGVNVLLFLPALAGICLTVIPYILQNVDFFGSVLKTVRGVTMLAEQPLPLWLPLSLAAIFLVLYLPLCALRKMRNACLSAALWEEEYAAG